MWACDSDLDGESGCAGARPGWPREIPNRRATTREARIIGTRATGETGNRFGCRTRKSRACAETCTLTLPPERSGWRSRGGAQFDVRRLLTERSALRRIKGKDRLSILHIRNPLTKLGTASTAIASCSEDRFPRCFRADRKHAHSDKGNPDSRRDDSREHSPHMLPYFTSPNDAAVLHWEQRSQLI